MKRFFLTVIMAICFSYPVVVVADDDADLEKMRQEDAPKAGQKPAQRKAASQQKRRTYKKRPSRRTTRRQLPATPPRHPVITPPVTPLAHAPASASTACSCSKEISEAKDALRKEVLESFKKDLEGMEKKHQGLLTATRQQFEKKLETLQKDHQTKLQNYYQERWFYLGLVFFLLVIGPLFKFVWRKWWGTSRPKVLTKNLHTIAVTLHAVAKLVCLSQEAYLKKNPHLLKEITDFVDALDEIAKQKKKEEEEQEKLKKTS